MEIIVSAYVGFCKGVQKAVDAAFSACEKPVFTLGRLIHNELVAERLAKEGISEIDAKTAYSLKSGTVVIRAHGVTQEVLERLSHTPVKVINATCPNVERIRRIVATAYAEGKNIIIIGDPKHPEVIGVNSCCGNQATVIEDCDFPPLDKTKEYVSVVQTTFDAQKYDYIINYLKNNLKSLVSQDTICYTTKERQAEAIRLSVQCDAMLVIGSKDSANVRRLYEVCKLRCPMTYLIDGVDCLNSVAKQNIQKLGVTAGASTPQELIMEVINLMSNEEITSKSEVEVAEDVSAAVPAAEDTVAAEAEVKAEAVEVKAEAVEDAKVEENDKPVIKKFNAPIKSMADWVANEDKKGNRTLHAGQKVKGKVISADEKGIIVSIGEKKEGFIAAEKAGLEEYNPADYPTDMDIDAVVVPNDSGSREFITLDKKTIDEVKKVDEALLAGVFELKIEKAVNGGLLGSAGSYSVFVPASHVELKKKDEEIDLETYVGKTITVMKLEDKDEKEKKGNLRRKRIVASHKKVVLDERKAHREEADRLWAEKRAKADQEKKDTFLANIDRFEVNNIVPGVVKRFTTFGAFVNVFGFDCLAATSELSWIKDVKPADVLEIGKEYEFVIIKVDPDNFKVSLSYKLLQKKPYELAAEKYPVGSIVKGKVQSIVSYGAFISIEPGIDGLVHISNISDKRISTPAEVLTVGQEVEAKVISFNDTRIALSIKDAAAPTENEEVVSDSKPVRAKRTDKAAAATDNRKSDRRKGRNEDNPEVKAEEEIVTAYGSTESVTNTIGDLLKGFDFSSEDDNK